MENIPHYFLYGESESSLSSDSIHCEPIFTRIKQQNFEIKPHRHDTYLQLLLLEIGQLEARFEADKIVLKAPCLVVIPPGHIHGFNYDPGARGKLTTVSETFLHYALGSGDWEWMRSLLTSIRMLTDKAIMTEVIPCIEAIHVEFEQRKPAQQAAIGALLKLTMVHLGRNIAGAARLEQRNPAYFQLFERFRQMAEQNFREHWRINDYCSRLGANERKLNRACRAICDLSPTEFLQQRLIEEAKRSLAYTVMPINAVTHELGFEDPAYFSRFFHRHTGASPRAYLESRRK